MASLRGALERNRGHRETVFPPMYHLILSIITFSGSVWPRTLVSLYLSMYQKHVNSSFCSTDMLSAWIAVYKYKLKTIFNRNLRVKSYKHVLLKNKKTSIVLTVYVFYKNCQNNRGLKQHKFIFPKTQMTGI